VELVQPWPAGYTINKRSPYGPRVHPITKKRTFHHGVDVALPVGTPLTAPADGVVVHKNRTDSAGHNLIIRHEGTWHTVYYHLQKASHLKVGAQVVTSEQIALSGNTGASTGPHLHWELRKSRKWGDTVDPVPYLVSEPSKPAPEPEPEPMRPTTVRPKQNPITPLSPSLARFFTIRRGLK
jgi:murein DD-endopeptidase MepM/ murein hydrolase activator NlpD